MKISKTTMMSIVSLLVALFLVVPMLGSVPGKGPSELRSIPVNVKKAQRLKMSQIASDVRKVVLQYSEESAFGRVRRLIVSDNIIVLDQLDNIMVFDINGRFIRQIGRQYKSRRLGSNIHDIAYDEAEGVLYLSTSDNGVVCLDLQGNLLKEMDLCRPRDAIYVNRGQIMLFSHRDLERVEDGYRNQAKMFVYNSVGENIDSVEVMTEIVDNRIFSFMNTYDYISFVGEQTYLHYPALTSHTFVKDTLYQYNDGKLTPAVKFDFYDIENLFQSEVRIFGLSKIWRTNNYIFVKYSYQHNDYLYVFDERNDSGINAKGGVQDNIHHCGLVEIRPLGHDMFYYTHQEEDPTGESNVDVYIGHFK